MLESRTSQQAISLVVLVLGLIALVVLVQGLIIIGDLFTDNIFVAIVFLFSVFFFVYAVKYYCSTFLVLFTGYQSHSSRLTQAQDTHQPFVSIHLPLYNEKAVVDRLLASCTSLNYEPYEIIVADDSTDETVEILKKWEKHPKVRINHREDRTGFKGGALAAAAKLMHPTTKFVLVFDADFIPPPDIIQRFLKHFPAEITDSKIPDSRIAAVQGYQLHILNANENWITKSIRTEFSGNYVIERAAQELYQGLKMIAGSVFMIRADLLRQLGWGTSLTEDWELTLRLYLEGYKVIYTPLIQAPGECLATFRQLVRQRTRWAEGHTFNVKRFFGQILKSTRLSRREKLEFLYYTPYYLKDCFYLVGITCWVVGFVLFNQSIPPKASLLGWSLLVCNALALPLMNITGLYLEGDLRQYLIGIVYQIALSHILVPIQACATLKGLIERGEGTWHRTLKSGRITGALQKLFSHYSNDHVTVIS
ncbi:MAG: glycosyltransferase [candidate division KSB1 bacterium]|nr:glycosyltransferase [candidate division KSB1 bacterium]